MFENTIARRLICVAPLSLSDFAFQAFAILAYISPVIHDIAANK